ncbi:unnamed protein product [Meganyctiphanes norvegica]|uniref:RING-type domain-containing protein n=1 Tax=Meganyctiphanes norvegica TaxID=48144 RepID=A0AAV2QBU3_MEGNR
MTSDLCCDGMDINKLANSSIGMMQRGERRFHSTSALLIESVRLETFADWKVSYVSPEALARVGFYYQKIQDHVKCIFCKGMVGYWVPGDQPEVEHRKHFPRCTFMQGQATGNVPREHTQNELSTLFKFLEKYHAFKVANTRPCSSNSNKSLVGQPYYPELNTVSSRQQTFLKHWPTNVNMDRNLLAEAGFFYTKVADWVQCFHCGGGIFNWMQGDNPMADHGRLYPQCPFVRMQLGDGGMLVNGMARLGDQQRPVSLNQSEAQLLLSHPFGKILVEMGLSAVSVREALRSLLETRGVLPMNIADTFQHVFDMESEEKRTQENNATNAANGSQEDMEVTTSSLNIKNVEELAKEVERLKQAVSIAEHRCRECGLAQACVVFQPCSHMHLCTNCARPRDTCPTCNTVIRGTLRPIIG